MNSYYQNRAAEFIREPSDSILRKLTFYGGNESPQVKAWEEEIDLMKDILEEWKNENAEIIFEYTNNSALR